MSGDDHAIGGFVDRGGHYQRLDGETAQANNKVDESCETCDFPECKECQECVECRKDCSECDNSMKRIEVNDDSMVAKGCNEPSYETPKSGAESEERSVVSFE